MPPSQGESSGPMTEAFHKKRLESASGAAEHPSGGVVIISRRSDISLEVALVLLEGAEAALAAGLSEGFVVMRWRDVRASAVCGWV
jgi:hypothetical protein